MNDIERDYRNWYAKDISPEFIKSYAMTVHKSVDNLYADARDRFRCKVIDSFIIEHADEIAQRMQDEFIESVLG